MYWGAVISVKQHSDKKPLEGYDYIRIQNVRKEIRIVSDWFKQDISVMVKIFSLRV